MGCGGLTGRVVGGGTAGDGGGADDGGLGGGPGGRGGGVTGALGGMSGEGKHYRLDWSGER